MSWGILSAAFLFIGTAAAAPLFAQPLGAHYISDGSVVGSLAEGYRMSGQSREYAQPFQIILPKGTRIAVAGEGGFFESEEIPGLFGFRLGEVYRLKITGVPFHSAAELYPTLETLNRLYPPPGRELDFPVKIEVTQEDLELAVAGNLVTRVVYLESPFGAAPIDSTDLKGGLTADCPPGSNPVAVAETRGKIMAILRIGSRLPEDRPNHENPFWFGLPPYTLPIKISADAE